MTGVWNLDLMETSFNKPAGIAPPMYGKNSKEQWKYDMHRSLFGNLDETPMKHNVTEMKKTPSKQPVSSGMGAAGT